MIIIKKKSEQSEVPVKRGRGRPKGSKNKEPITTRKERLARRRQLLKGKGIDRSIEKTIVPNKTGTITRSDTELISTLLESKAPDTEGKKHLNDEKAAGQVEILLLKGVTKISDLAALLDISELKVKQHIDRIYYRWAHLGNKTQNIQAKGEARARLDYITSELWVVYSNADTTSSKTQALREILSVHDRRINLDGLTPAVLLNINTSTAEGNSISDRINEHSRVVSLLDSLALFAKKKEAMTNAVEAEFSEVME